MMDIFERLEAGNYENKVDYSSNPDAWKKEDLRLVKVQARHPESLQRWKEQEEKSPLGFGVEYGHAQGLDDVACYYSEMVDLIK